MFNQKVGRYKNYRVQIKISYILNQHQIKIKWEQLSTAYCENKTNWKIVPKILLKFG